MSARIPVAVILLVLSTAAAEAARTAPIDARHARIVDVTAYPVSYTHLTLPTILRV